MHSSVCAPTTTSRPTPRPASTSSSGVSSKESAYCFSIRGSASSGDSSPTLCQSSLPFPGPSSCTPTTGTCSRRALSTRLATLATTVSRSCAPATTPVCTSITSSAVLGRPSSVVISCPSLSPTGTVDRGADKSGGRGLGSTGGRPPDGPAHDRVEIVGELGSREGLLVRGVEGDAGEWRVVPGELEPARVQQEPESVGRCLAVAGEVVDHPRVGEGPIEVELLGRPAPGVDDVGDDQPPAGRQQRASVRQHDAGIADVVQGVYGQHDVERPVLGRYVQDAATLVVDVGPGPFSPSDVEHSICDVDCEHIVGVVGQQDAVPARSTPEVNGRGHPLGQVRKDPVVEAAADAVPDPGEAVEQVGECVEVGGVLGRDGARRLGHRGPISFTSFPRGGVFISLAA